MRAEQRQNDIGEGLKAGGSHAFHPAASKQQDAVPERGKPPTSKRKRDAPSMTRSNKVPPVPLVSFTVILLDRTSQIHCKKQRRPTATLVTSYDAADHVKSVQVPKDASPETINSLIVSTFEHIPAFSAVASYSGARRAWTLLLATSVRKGQKTQIFLHPISTDLLIDFSRLERATSDAKPRGAGTGYSKTVWIALVNGSPDIRPYIIKGKVDHSDEDEEAEDGDEDDDEEVEEPDAMADDKDEVPNTFDSYTFSPSPSPTEPSFSKRAKTQPMDTNTTDSQTKVEDFIDPQLYADFSAPHHEKATDSSSDILELPASHTFVVRALENIKAPVPGKSWWAAVPQDDSSLEPTDLYDVAFLIWTGVLKFDLGKWKKSGRDDRMTGPQAIWAHSGNDFLSSINFILNKDAFTSPGFRLGPRGISFIIDALEELYLVTDAIPIPEARRERYDKHCHLILHSDALETLLRQFLAITPRQLYDPEPFRHVEVLLLRDEANNLLPVAEQLDWDLLKTTKVDLIHGEPSHLLSALETDFGTTFDHSKFNTDYLATGEWGLKGFMDKIVLPFLDNFPLDHPFYKQYYDIFSTFMDVLDHKISNYNKNAGKKRAGEARAKSKAPETEEYINTEKRQTRSTSGASKAGGGRPNSASSGNDDARTGTPLFDPYESDSIHISDDGEEDFLREELKKQRYAGTGNYPSDPIVVSSPEPEQVSSPEPDTEQKPAQTHTRPKPRPMYSQKPSSGVGARPPGYIEAAHLLVKAQQLQESDWCELTRKIYQTFSHPHKEMPSRHGDHKELHKTLLRASLLGTILSSTS
ncbi:hypothetical protein BV25DRAFT_1918310 [Artomyces pyxidatus]|uniref:Uncharacterized protein n=1 Tax=Artomyces pyxidatus TaxID=48021 RepID=A0ACB8STP0_9AGAM|nr:hypothetical protein BV25DRAFT_1918310 [Artomyces pyxidatus]